MGKQGKILLALGALGSLAFLGAAIQGYGLDGAVGSRGPLQTHLVYGLGATLAIFFAHTWVLVYLLSLRRELSKWRQARDGASAPAGKAETLRVRTAASWASAASALVLGAFLLGPATLLLVVPPWTHGGVFVLALAVQVGALFVEHRALARSDRTLAECRSFDESAVEAAP